MSKLLMAFAAGMGILIVFGFVATLPFTTAQLGWNNIYRGDQSYLVFSLQQTSDEGYVLGGYAWNVSAGSSDPLLIRVDSKGAILWNRTYDAGNDAELYSVQQTSDGGYIAAGARTLFENVSALVLKQGYFLMKVDSNGNPVWNRTYGGISIDAATSVQQTSDGGYILAGCTNSYGNGSIWLVKTDSKGNMVWNETYPGTMGDQSDLALNFGNAPRARQTLDGGYIISGITSEFQPNAVLIKVNETGGITWKRTYGAGYTNYVEQTFDGGYIVVGTATPTVYQPTVYPRAWLIKTYPNGSEQWSKTYGGDPPTNEFGNYVEQTPDGGYMVAGKVYLDSWSGLVMRTDSNGTVLWSRTIPEMTPLYSDKDIPGTVCAKLTSDGECVFAATIRTYDFAPGSSTGYLHLYAWVGVVEPPQFAIANVAVIALSIALMLEIIACVALVNKKESSRRV